MGSAAQPVTGHLVRARKIAVVGGAMAGATFAVALRKLAAEAGVEPLPDIQVFERDRSAEERADRGYSLSVRSDSGGMQVLQRLGALDAVWAAREPGAHMHLARGNFRPLVTMKLDAAPPGLPASRVRVTRGRLRAALLALLEPGTLHYGRTVTGAEPPSSPGGRVVLRFQDGAAEEFDLVVAADGASSKLRGALLPDERLRYAGVVQVAGTTRPLHPLPKEALAGQWMMMGPRGVGLFLAVMNQDQVIWSLSFKAPESRVAELQAALAEPAAAQRFLEQEVPRLAEGFSEPLPSLIRATPASALWAAPARELAPHANAVPVVFIGDAWHAMSPFSGNGANMAMRDGLELAEELMRPQHARTAEAVAAFVQRAAPRSCAAIADSHRIIDMAHTSGWRQLYTVAVLWLMGWVLEVVARVRGMTAPIMMRLFRGALDITGDRQHAA